MEGENPTEGSEYHAGPARQLRRGKGPGRTPQRDDVERGSPPGAASAGETAPGRTDGSPPAGAKDVTSADVDD